MIKLSQSCLGEEEKEAVAAVLDARHLGMGQKVQEFETALKNFIGNDTIVTCTNTGTSALQLALQACGIGPGDDVLVPSITYVASFQAVSATGATPIACDVRYHDCWIDVEDAARKITSRTKAIMPVHYAGSTGNLAEVYAFANAHGLRVIEDAAHSFGGFFEQQRIGAIGDVICFSFDGIKNITCGEGGAISTRDEAVSAAICDLRLLGVEKDTVQRYQGGRSWDFDVTQQGWRYHMSNINAAIGLEQLKKIDTFAAKKSTLWQAYVTGLEGILPYIKIDLTQHIPHVFVARVPAKARDDLKNFLLQNSIESGIHYKPNHLLTKYRQSKCPTAETLWEELLSLPFHCNLTLEDIKKVVACIHHRLK